VWHSEVPISKLRAPTASRQRRACAAENADIPQTETEPDGSVWMYSSAIHTGGRW
jgi:hypothetical protein